MKTEPLRNGERLTLDWADAHERRRVTILAAEAGRQTMNLRTMPDAALVVLRHPGGGFAGWAGMDVRSDPGRPEVFSQFVYPRFRGLGLGALLEHVWWAYLDAHGCETGFMRMELETNRTLFERRLASGYCRQVSAEDLGGRFVHACRNCELFGVECRQQAFLAVDVRKALAASVRSRGPLDLRALPLQVGAAQRQRPSVRATGS